MKPLVAMVLLICSLGILASETKRRYDIMVSGNIQISITFPGGEAVHYTRAAQIQALKEGIELLQGLEKTK